MGGKNKQRTKGNVRPSSSGRAAELLARESGVVPGFVGFGSSVTTEHGYVPAVHGAEEIDSLVDADFRLVLRKLSKRDTVTKLKAIQEFGSMCQERDAETVKGVLPYWPRIYCKISVDHDRRVREATQQAFEQLVLKVRRDLAPFLKSLMGHWLLAQCDTHTPAASAARQVFAAAFPPSKQPGALSFCRDEVLNVLHDTLLKETADTLSDPQSIPEEERESKITRMVISSLLGLKKLLHLLPDEDVKVAEDRLTQLVSPAKFWKYSKHRTAQVRGAFFQVISALCCHSPGLVQTEAARACSAVLLGIDDTDPMVLPALWEAVLHVITTVPDCWTHVNARKGFLPKLWALLKEGGGGMAKALHPNLMPLISKLPPHVTGTPLDFCTTFFSSLIQGLSGERAVASPTESAAIVTAMVECLRFSIMQSAAEGDEHRRTQRMLVSQQLLPLLERALGDPSLQNGPLFLLVTEMLISWEKRAGFDGGEDLPAGGSVFRALLGDFWEGLGVLLVGVVDVEDADAKTLEGVATLLRVMRYPEKATRKQGAKKRKAKICFSEPGDGEGRAVGGGERADGTPEQRGSEPETEPERGSLQTRPLEDAVCRLARLCLTYVNEKKSESHLVFLSLLLCSFHEPRVFTMLVESEGGKAGGEGAELKNAAMRFLLERVVAWLTEEGRRDSRPVVEMVFSAVHCCSPQETTRILDHVTTMDLPCGILLQIIQRASADAEALAICGDWLKGSVLGDRLLGLAEELCNAGRGCSSLSSNENAHSWSLISLVLSQHHNNEPLIGEVYLERILEAFHATLSETRGLSEPLVVFICDAASTFFSSVNDCLLLASSEELLLTVFQITALEPSHTHLSDSLLAKLRGVCLAGVGALVHLSGDQVREDGFLCSAALWVKRQLLTASLDSKSLQVLVAAVQSVAETLNAAGRHDSPLHGHFLSLMTPSQPEWTKIRQALPPQWVKSPLLSGRLRMAPDRPGPDAWTRATHARLPAHLCTCALLGRLLQTAAPAPPRRQGAPSTCYPSLKHTVTELLYALQWSKEMEGSSSPSALQWSKEMEGSSSPSAHHSLLAAWGLLSNDLSSLLPATDLLDALYRRSVEDGGLWSLTLASYIQASSPLAADADPVRRLYGAPDSWFPVSRSKLSTLQAMCPAMARADREAVAACAAAGVVAWRESDDVCGSLAMLLSCLEADTRVQEEVLRAVLAAMMEWRNSREDWLLFSSDLSKASADQLTLAVEMMRFLSWLLTASPTVLGGSQWDFLLCCLLAWLQTAGENVSSLWNPWAQLFVCVSAALVVKLHRFFSAPPPDAADQLPAELTAEWTDFFSEGIYSLLLHLPIKITEAFPEPDDPLFPSAVLRSAGAALTHIPVQQLRQNSLPARGAADRRSELPPALQNLLDALCPLLLFRSRPLQVTVYRLLDKVMSLLPECEGEGESRSEDDSEEPSRSPPEPLMVVLAACEELCDSALAGVQVGECAVVKPLSAEYSCFLGYLLSWKLLLAFFKASPSQLRVQYSLHLRRSQSLHKLLIHVFKMMPENPVYPGQSADAKDTKTFFTESLSLSVDESGGVEWELPHLACSVYYSAVQDLPAMVRLWWNSQEKRVSTAVERFTIRHVSPVLSAQEVSSVHASTQTFDSMTVKARPAAREVVATYSVDDIFIELVIQLPHSYPLGAITVESGRRVGVAVQQWRNWMLQLSTYLTHQNGSIMEGLALWKNNVDKRFEGVEDCMICFSVIHGSNYSLPKKACRTCRKKFHSACLYKWFTSSNKSTCPLCRETFF